jgi:integrase
MASVNFYLKDTNGGGTAAIQMFFRYKKTTVKLATGESINPNHWDHKKKKILTKFSRSYSSLQAKLDELENVISGIHRKLEINGGTISQEILKNKFKEHFGRSISASYTLVSFAEWYVKQVEQSKRPSTLKGYRNTVKHLKEFQIENKIQLSFDVINIDFYLNFTDFLKSKDFQPNTIGKQIKNIKVFLNEATERGINKNMEYKSRRFKVISEETDAIYLDQEELAKLYDLDLGEYKRLERVRDLFLVGCYTGLRFSDLSQLKRDHVRGGFIYIKTQKTNDSIVIPVHKIVKEIMRRYDEITDNGLPPVITNQKMNEYLKEIGKMAAIEERVIVNETKGNLKVQNKFKKYDLISTHTARRSFATNLYLSGFPAMEIRKITGHKTELAFLRYIKMEAERSANRLKAHWEM